MNKTLIKLKIRRLYWRIFGQPNYPPLDFTLIDKINLYTDEPIVPRYQRISSLYLIGIDIQSISDYYNVTRERVRQCVWKSYREHEKSFYTISKSKEVFEWDEE